MGQPEMATNPASGGSTIFEDRDDRVLSHSSSVLHSGGSSTSEPYSTYVVDRSALAARRGLGAWFGFQKRSVARPLLFPSPPGTPSLSSGGWRSKIRRIAWSEEMRYMLVGLCLFCVLVQVALMYRWAQSGVRTNDVLVGGRGPEFDSSTAMLDAPLPSEGVGPRGARGLPASPRKLSRSAAAVFSKFRDTRQQNTGPRSMEDLVVSVLSVHSSRVLLPAMKSRADLNHDGHVTQQELTRFVARHGQDRIAQGVERAMAAALDATWGPLAEDLPPSRTSRSCELKFTPEERSHLQVAVSDGFQFSDTRPFCIEAWVRPTASEEGEYGGVILSKYNGGVQGQLRLEILKDGSLKLHREVAPYGLQSDAHIPPDAYTHIAASYGFGWAALYVNGSMAAMQREGGVPDDSVTPVLIGATLEKGEPSGFFSGSIADMRVWSMSCQQIDMKAHMNHTLAGWEHGLVAYWKFDECMGDIVRDKAGVHDGVIKGTSTSSGGSSSSGGGKWMHAGLGLAVGDQVANCKKWAKEQLEIT